MEKVQALNEIRRRVQTATEKNLLFKQIDENFGDGEALFTFAFDQTDTYIPPRNRKEDGRRAEGGVVCSESS